MRRITLNEYRTKEAVALTAEERDTLAATLPGLSVSPTPGRPGHYDLTPGSWIGVVDLESVSVEVLPKLPIENVSFLISYALQRSRWPDVDAGLRRQPGLLEALVPIFVELARRALRRGLMQGYRSTEDALLTVRGRVRFDDQIRDRFGIAPPIEVRYDEFTVDSPMNRLIRAAVHRLAALRIRSPQSRRDLRTLDARLAGVSLVQFPPGQLPEIHYNRLNRRYRPLVELAKLILRSTSLDVRSGSRPVRTLVIDMNQVFEDFVVVALREALGLTERSFPQNCHGRPLFLDNAGRVKLRPDLSWWEAGRCVFVGDVKYKRVEQAGFKHADLYQMLAYCTATGLPGGLLIYAAGEAEPVTHRIPGADRVIQVDSLNLRGSNEDVLCEVESIARDVRTWRRSIRHVA